MVIGIIFPLIVTALGLIYIFSPLDFLPMIFLGPIGILDDLFVGIIIFLSWMIFFSAPLLEMVFNVIAGVLIIAGLIWVVNWLWRKSK